MLQKDIEARIKDYPNLIKEENNRLNVLKTALANLNQSHQSKLKLIDCVDSVKEINGLAVTIQGIDHSKESSTNFLQLYQSMGSTLKFVQEEQNNKASRVKDMVTAIDNLTKENLENVKELQAKAAAGSVTGIQLMHRDLRIIQKHKVRV